MDTLDKVFAECKKLNDEDFGVLLSAMMREQKDRDCRAQSAAWNNVCKALDDYVEQYGYFTIFYDGEDMEFYKGDYAFGEPGELSVGE